MNPIQLPANRRCTKPTCYKCPAAPVIFSRQTNLCAVHYRMRQMKYDAQASGKVIPDDAVIQSLFDAAIADGMKCPVCGVVMNWRATDGRKTVLSLQHNRDGTFGLMCLGCNVRHQFYPGDDFYSIPAGHRHCKGCNVTKPLTEFSAHRYPKRQAVYPRTLCKKCDSGREMRRRREKC